MSALRVELRTAPDADVRWLIGELDEELSALSPPEQRHGLALDAIFRPHIQFFLVYRGDAPLGCGGVAFFADFAEVKRMYVRPEARGQGVADAIMARLVEETSLAGLTCLRLETGTDFIPANRFYRRWRFQPCPIFEPYASKPPHTVAGSAFLERRLQ